jgi:elongation factor P--(R)-beta-lysine ligase
MMRKKGDFPDRRYPGRLPTERGRGDEQRIGGKNLCGRLIALGKEGGVLQERGEERVFRWAGEPPEVREGEILSLRCWQENGELLAERLQTLVPVANPWEGKGDWGRFNRNQGRVGQNMLIRDLTIRGIRDFFQRRGFVEVETPAMVREPGQEAHLQLFETAYCIPGKADSRFLISSPEHHMKRLLGSGFERIFQICRCYRNGESSETHSPEFTMLEWYRAYASYEEIMMDAEELVVQVSREVGGKGEIERGGKRIGLEGPWQRFSVEKAFSEFAAIELDMCESVEEFREKAMGLGYGSVGEEDSWEDIFFKILLEKVEPALSRVGPVFLLDYPARMAALAKLKEANPDWAERVELYIGGMELANGFTELNDPREQRQRFNEERKRRLMAGNFPLPLDEEFLTMMEQGMPPAGGMALGVDRLVMLLAGAETIAEVIAFPFES